MERVMKTITAVTNENGGVMKNLFAFLSCAVILAVMATVATAGSAIVLRGEIPFDFHVGNQVVPAGEYYFEMGRVGDATTSSVTLTTKDGKMVALTLTRDGVRKEKASSQVNFYIYEGEYFLSSVECPGYKADLKKTRPVSEPDTIFFALSNVEK